MSLLKGLLFLLAFAWCVAGMIAWPFWDDNVSLWLKWVFGVLDVIGLADVIGNQERSLYVRALEGALE